MNLKFIKYNWEEFLEEESFLSWVKRNENNDDWEKFIALHPEVKQEINHAREILQLLQDETSVVEKTTIENIWQHIDRYDQSIRGRGSINFNFRRTFSWAASILLVAFIGTLSMLYWQTGNHEYEFSAFNGKEGSLILPSGEKIMLTRSNSRIFWNEEGDLIVNDSIFSLDFIPSENDDDRLGELLLPFGFKTELVLSDGTVIWLNAGSKLAFPLHFNGEYNRKVFLEGEACFQVEKGKQSFIVTTDGLDIKVLGTLFNVSAYPEQETIETVLVNGSVTLNTTNKIFGGETVLSPNQKANFIKEGNEVFVIDEPDVDKYIAWVRDWLEYRRESLNSVFQKLERYYDVRFHLPSNFPADDRISGKLDLKESLDNILMILSDAAEIEYQVKGKEIFIRPKSEK